MRLEILGVALPSGLLRNETVVGSIVAAIYDVA